MRSSHIGAVVGAVGLHALVLALIWPSSPEKVGRKPPPANDALHAVLLPQADGHASKAISPEARAGSPTKPSQAHPDASGPVVDRPDPENYRQSNAVDQVAVPVGEWAINTSLLPMGRPCMFVATIWVSAGGKVDRWEVQSEAISEELTAAVFRQFDDTFMNPALVGAIPVASVQRLELVVERQ